MFSKKLTKKLLALGAAAMLALAAAGCGGSDKQEAGTKAGGPKGEVMVYTSIYPDIIDNAVSYTHLTLPTT